MTPNHIIFYDIASAPPITPFAPNPWKARYALNFKGVQYKTEWVELTQVENVRKKLGAAPVRTFRDGSSYYTLPVIQDLSTGEVVGDSFDIALYLDKTYPNSQMLLPSSTIGLHAAFNAQVDAIFSQAWSLFAHGIRFNPETAEKSKADFVWRAGVEKWADLNLEGEARTRMLETFKAALGELANVYKRCNGPFLEGEKASYADLIVGGWLMFISHTLKEWDQVKTWHDGLWGRLHQALDKYAQAH